MKIIPHTSSIPQMLNFLRDLKNQRASKEDLVKLLNHPDYDYEFKRYALPSKEPLVEYLMQLNTIYPEDIPELTPKQRQFMLRHKHSKWLAAYENPGYYESLHNKINTYLTEDLLENICISVTNGLPDGVETDNIRAISTMSIGTSFGYVYDGAFHFDIMGIDDGKLDTLPELIAHEVHHLVFMKYISAFYDSLTPEERYIFNFSGEGLAIKFCNNAKGAISKQIDASKPANTGLDAFSMKYLNERFHECYLVFEDTLDKIRAGKMNDDDISKQFNDFWLKFHIEGQTPNDEPALKQPRMYSFGNDLYGSIYDAYGKDVLFDCVQHPLKALKYFTDIVNNI